MSNPRLPEEWHQGAEAKQVPTSLRGIADHAGVSVSAVSRLIKGQGTSAKTVRAVADLLFDGDVNRVWRLHGSGLEDHGPFERRRQEATGRSRRRRAATIAQRGSPHPAETKG